MDWHTDREQQFGPLIEYASHTTLEPRYYLEHYMYMGHEPLKGLYYYKHIESREHLVLKYNGRAWGRVFGGVHNSNPGRTLGIGRYVFQCYQCANTRTAPSLDDAVRSNGGHWPRCHGQYMSIQKIDLHA